MQTDKFKFRKNCFFFEMNDYCKVETCVEFAMANLTLCQLHFVFDFNESHDAWLRNKTKVGSLYKYVCGHKKTNGQFCKKRIYRTLLNPDNNYWLRTYKKIPKQMNYKKNDRYRIVDW